MVIGDRSKKAHEAGGGEGTDQGSTEVATKGQGLRNVAQRDMRLDAQVDEGEKQEAVSVDKGLESSFAEPRGLFPSSSSRVDGSTGLRSEQVRNRETDRLQEQVYRCRGPQRDAMISSDLLGLWQYVETDWARDVSETDMDSATPNTDIIPDLQVISSLLWPWWASPCL